MFEISGQVLDNNGFAIENAPESIAGICTLTDEMGFFTISCISPGSHFISAEHRDYDQAVAPIMVDRDIPDFPIILAESQGIQAI